MVRDHQAVNQQALALVKKLHVTPQDNPTSQAPKAAADAKLAELEKLKGAAFYRAYAIDPGEVLQKTFAEVGGYDELVVLKDIRVVSCCEHHMLPIIDKAHIGYLPDRRVVGISKLARVVDGFSRRLQIQEKMAADIAGAIEAVLKPRGLAL